MKIATLVCSLGALVCALAALGFLSSKEAGQRFYRAHNKVEEIAFKEVGTEELKKAVTDERAADKDRFVVHDLGRRLVWGAAGFSTVALLLSVFAKRTGNA